jgi:hypothetical protein
MDVYCENHREHVNFLWQNCSVEPGSAYANHQALNGYLCGTNLKCYTCVTCEDDF